MKVRRWTAPPSPVGEGGEEFAQLGLMGRLQTGLQRLVVVLGYQANLVREVISGGGECDDVDPRFDSRSVTDWTPRERVAEIPTRTG